MKEKPERAAPAMLNSKRAQIDFRKVNMSVWPQGLKSLRLFFYLTWKEKMLDKLQKIVTQAMPEIRKSLPTIALPEDDKIVPGIARAILVCAKVHEVKQHEVHVQNVQTMGERARMFYSEGEDVCTTKLPDMPKAAARFDREKKILKVWRAGSVKHGPRVSKDAELCPRARAMLNAGIKALDKKKTTLSPVDFRGLFPKSIKNRKDGAKYTLVTTENKIRVEGIESRIKPEELRLITDDWWAIFQVMNKDAMTWSYAVDEFFFPSYSDRGIFVLSDGDRIAIGAAK